MPADNEPDPLDRWLNEQARPLPPPSGTFELITKRARRRRIRQAVVSVASAAAVAAAVGVAVPVGMSLRLAPSPTSVSMAAGSSATSSARPTQSTLSTSTPGTKESKASAATPRPAASASSASAPGLTTPGYLPPYFRPFSVTWDSTSTGWIMGPAGTPGHCGAQQDSSICTSIARTDDGGQTWQGLPAPPVGGPMAATGVSGLRFLNASDGWAFGPELWATDDGGEHWHQVATGGSSVTDLETVDGRAYALFGDCAAPAGPTGDTIADCRTHTLETATAGSDSWTPVDGVPAALSAGTTALSSAVLELAGPTGNQPATGYLVAPDGTLYSGPLDGTAWHRSGQLPCTPGAAANDGLPQDVLLSPAGTTSSGAARLALVCVGPGSGDTTAYLSNDGGVTWVKQSTVGSAGLAHVGVPQTLTALMNGTLILATEGSASAPGGIYLLPLGASKWQPATLSDPSQAAAGFMYVGMTSDSQGVALSGDPSRNEIWMTVDGGQTWQARAIQD
jgi:hypothetical protein